MPHADYAARLAQAKAASTAQLLMKCGRLCNDRGLDLLRRKTGQAGLRTAHTNLLPHIDLDGTRLTEVARRMGISKQAVGQLVEEMEAMDMLERVPDPGDGRARLVRFSATGRAGLFEGLAALGELEAGWRALLGDAAMDHLHEALTRLLPHLEAPEAPAPNGGVS